MAYKCNETAVHANLYPIQALKISPFLFYHCVIFFQTVQFSYVLLLTRIDVLLYE